MSSIVVLQHVAGSVSRPWTKPLPSTARFITKNTKILLQELPQGILQGRIVHVERWSGPQEHSMLWRVFWFIVGILFFNIIKPLKTSADYQIVKRVPADTQHNARDQEAVINDWAHECSEDSSRNTHQETHHIMASRLRKMEQELSKRISHNTKALALEKYKRIKEQLPDSDINKDALLSMAATEERVLRELLCDSEKLNAIENHEIPILGQRRVYLHTGSSCLQIIKCPYNTTTIDWFRAAMRRWDQEGRMRLELVYDGPSTPSCFILEELLVDAKPRPEHQNNPNEELLYDQAKQYLNTMPWFREQCRMGRSRGLTAQESITGFIQEFWQSCKTILQKKNTSENLPVISIDLANYTKTVASEFYKKHWVFETLADHILQKAGDFLVHAELVTRTARSQIDPKILNIYL